MPRMQPRQHEATVATSLTAMSDWRLLGAVLESERRLYPLPRHYGHNKIPALAPERIQPRLAPPRCAWRRSLLACSRGIGSVPMSAVTSQAETPALAADARIEAEHQMHAQQPGTAQRQHGKWHGERKRGCRVQRHSCGVHHRQSAGHEPRSVAGGAGTAGVPGPAM